MTPEELAKLHPWQKCYCGWHKLGECPHCPDDAPTESLIAETIKQSSVCRCFKESNTNQSITNLAKAGYDVWLRNRPGSPEWDSLTGAERNAWVEATKEIANRTIDLMDKTIKSLI